MGGISIWQIVLILLVIGILFGAGRLPALGRDLGKAIKGFRHSMEGEGEDEHEEPREGHQRKKNKRNKSPHSAGSFKSKVKKTSAKK